MPATVPIDQIAVLIYAGKGRHRTLAGARIVLFPHVLADILGFFENLPIAKAVVSEQYPILRTLQFVSDYRDTIFSAQPDFWTQVAAGGALAEGFRAPLARRG